MATTTTNFGWDIPQSTDLVKDGATAIAALGQDIDTALVDLKGGTTGQALLKASGSDLDFTWGSAASGGITLIQETVASTLSSLSFSAIPGTYKQLYLVWAGVRHSGTGSQFAIRFNNVSTTSYFLNGFQGQGSTFNVNGTDQTHLGGIGNDPIYAFGEATSNAAGYQTDCNGQLVIDNYASTTRTKNVKWNTGYFDNGVSRYNSVNSTSVFNSTTAITSIDIVRLTGSATFTNQNNSSIRLYGVS
jgi:hypothetical protein